MYNSAADLVVKAWLNLYKQAPKITMLITIFILSVSIVVVYTVEQKQREKLEARRLQNESYVKQVESLEQVRNNLNALIKFVDSEKKQLELSERALTTMKSEHERLKPLVDADRKVINALFAAQEARNQDAQNKERWLGFGLGLIASLIASLLWAIIVYIVNRRNNAPNI